MPRSFSSARSSSGAGALRSLTTNAASSTIAAAPSSAGWTACSVSPARATASTSRATPAVAVTAPGRSSCPRTAGGSGGSSRNEAASSAMPIGTLTKKTSRQVTSTSSPPSTAPDAKPAETTAP